MKLYRGDLKPDLQITLTDVDPTDTNPDVSKRRRVPIDLTTASSIRIIGKRDTVLAFDRTVAGTAAGVIVMPWQTGDTATPGRIDVEVEVMWPGAKPQTFRPTSAVDITGDYA